jgi:hypothetical protein
MDVAVPMKSARAAAEAAIGHAAKCDRPSVRADRLHSNPAGPATTARNEAHRYGADGRGTHHGQDDAAGTFHGDILVSRRLFSNDRQFPSLDGNEASESGALSQQRAGSLAVDRLGCYLVSFRKVG